MNKKKILCSILFAIICICMFLPNFYKKTIKVTNAIASESSISGKQDIVPVNYNEMTSELKNSAVSAQNPFDSSTASVMPGYSITPKTSTTSGGKNYNEIKNVSYSVLEFQIRSGQSVFMWIYFPDDPLENWYSLSLLFKDLNGNSIEWNFTPTDLSSLMNDVSAYRYGWKLIELTYDSAIKSNGFNENSTLFIFQISYEIILNDIASYLGEKTEFEDSSYLTNGKLSFYHVFLGNSISSTSNIAINTNYYYYSLKQSFLNELDGLILNETYTVKQLSDMFDYIYAGKSNLLLTAFSNNKFEFTYTFLSNSIVNDRFPNEKFTFDSAGEYSFIITLKENRYTRSFFELATKQEQKLVFKLSHSFNIHEYVFGKFNDSLYEMKKNNNYIITFSLKSDFNLTGGIKFVSENEKTIAIKSINYNSDLKRYEIVVVAKNSGRANINAFAVGTCEKKPNAQEYSSSSTVEVGFSSSGYSELFKFIITILIASAILSCVFMIFTIINIKKNKRLQKRQ